jgi:hypothetical protein
MRNRREISMFTKNNFLKIKKNRKVKSSNQKMLRSLPNLNGKNWMKKKRLNMLLRKTS